jgi:propionate CoA-transferase
MAKIVSVEEAVSQIKDFDILAVNGMMWVGGCRMFYPALEERFLRTGSPGNLSLFSSCGLGHAMNAGTKPELANCLAHPGLVKKIVTSHVQSFVDFLPMIQNNEIEAYIISQGTVSAMLHSAARRVPRTMTRVGLQTFLDPRHKGGALNDISTEKIVDVGEIDGEEYLFYKTIYPNVCLIRGTTADAAGNITCEHETVTYDSLVTAQAVKNNGGVVIVQVERANGGFANAQDVRIPGKLVDYIYVDPEQKQTFACTYNGAFSGEVRYPRELLEKSIAEDMKDATNRPLADRVITRRAALEIRKGDILNLGIGLPVTIGLEAVNMGIATLDEITFTIELGVFGGVPAGGKDFGVTINPDAIYDQYSQFEFYEGGGLDKTFVGALELDQYGNDNVVKKGKKLIGVGGFNYVTQMAKSVVFCTKFMSKSGYGRSGNGFEPFSGGAKKLVSQVENITYNGELARKKKQKALYITERCVFASTGDGIELIEVSPYVDLQKDVLDLLDFKPAISKDLKPMPGICFAI